MLVGCNAVKQAVNTISNLKNVQFKLGTANNFAVNNVNISQIHSISDIGVGDALRLTQAFANKTMPVSFNLNVLANNPNSTTTAGKKSDALISHIDWVLLIDDKETVNGSVTSPITIPGSNQTTTIPINIGLDLYKFFGNNGYADVMNLALAIGGVNGSTSRLKLKIRPTISIEGITIPYPSYITAIDKEFRGK
jgi:hypothetical protein